MATNDNEGWDGIDQNQEDRKARSRIDELLKKWKERGLTKAQAGTKTVSDQSSSQGSGTTINPGTIPERYYGFIDDEEIFKTSTGRWRIRTYDCIGEATFWRVLGGNDSLYQVLENKHNSASKTERQNRKNLHDKLFESKYGGTEGAHQTIHFLEKLPDNVGSGEKKETPWGWALIEATKKGTTKADLAGGQKDGLTEALETGKAQAEFQLCAPLLTDAEVSSVEAKILDEKEFEAVVPFLEEIFSLHHIPDADIWGDDPTPLDPTPPPIILSEGFALNEDMGLWPDREFTGKKLAVNLDNIRQLPPESTPRAHIPNLGWFDIWLPTDVELSKTQLYLLRKEDDGFWGFRLKIEQSEVLISESYSEGFKPKGLTDEKWRTLATVGKEGEGTELAVMSGSPPRLVEQPESLEQSSESASSNVKKPPEEATIRVPKSDDGPPRTPRKQNTKRDKLVTKQLALEKAKGTRTPLKSIGNMQRNISGKVGTSNPSSIPLATSSSFSQPKGKHGENSNENKENQENVFHVNYMSSNWK